MRNVLVIAEIALALVLVAGAGLMVRSFLRLQRVDPGFYPKNILTLRLTLPEARYREDSQARAFFEQARATRSQSARRDSGRFDGEVATQTLPLDQ